jgi:hypothetical protein
MVTRASFALAAAIVVNAIAAFAMATSAIAQSQAPPPSRQADVEQRGMAVMPFDQKRTMHMFRQTPSGGVQTVMSKDGDPGQIEMIRSHLRREAANFARGDYSDPIAIHGAQMPGLAFLRTARQKVVVAFQELPEGAQMTFTTSDPMSLKALHDWFAAQVSDHGPHAVMMK